MSHEISIKRVYEEPSDSDGPRFLVERLWPRGIKKEALKLNGWVREVAPSAELRKWFAHDPAKWAEFQRRYRAELDATPEPWKKLLHAAENERITLLFSSRDAVHNNVTALRAYLLDKRGR